VNISFSSASLHIGSRCSRQNARLHDEQPEGEALRFNLAGGFSASLCVERGMMVLFLKQVHLQNDGEAGES
jgi:hypothetical protein